VAGIIILTVTSTNHNLKSLNINKLLIFFFYFFPPLDGLYSWKFRKIVSLSILCHVLVLGWPVFGRSTGLKLCFFAVLFPALFGCQVPDTGNVSSRVSTAFTCMIQSPIVEGVFCHSRSWYSECPFRVVYNVQCLLLRISLPGCLLLSVPDTKNIPSGLSMTFSAWY
jgi:hypothetical protein